MLIICAEMMKERAWTATLLPLLSDVPAVLLVNYWLEVAFAERWFSRATGRKGFAIGGASLSPGEASL